MSNKQIIIKDNYDLEYSGFSLSSVGLKAVGKPTFEQWKEVGKFIKKANQSVQFWWGDWLNYGEPAYGQKYSQALESSDYEEGTLRDASWVANKIPLSCRHDNLSFEHHRQVASLESKEQNRFLDLAEKNEWSVKELRKQKNRFLLDSKRLGVTTLDSNLILGDAVKELNKLPDGSIDCLITDPPYGIDYQSNRREVLPKLDKLKNDTKDAFNLLDEMCKAVEPKIKDNSHLYFFTSWKVYSKFEAIISKHFDIKNLLVWDKLNHGSGDLEGNYAEQHELIIFAAKGRRILNGDRPVNIIPYNKVPNLEHPTKKPVGLIKMLIEISTNKDELVCDPFMGTGSTCIAAKDIKRKYVGIEIDKKWFNLAQKRINEC